MRERICCRRTKIDNLDPFAYRPLLITPILDRAWAKIRLRHLQPWIASWALPAILGGIQGIGAVGAWCATSIDVAWAMATATPLVGGALDLVKCFDQILRPLLYAVLRIAGLPEDVLTAYISTARSRCGSTTPFRAPSDNPIDMWLAYHRVVRCLWCLSLCCSDRAW